MTRHAKTLAVALTGAAAVGSTAYALGSESGSGTATAKSARSTSAATTPGRGIRGPGRDGAGLDALAKRLGVTSAQLRAAFDDLRPEKPAGDPRKRFADELATALECRRPRSRRRSTVCAPTRSAKRAIAGLASQARWRRSSASKPTRCRPRSRSCGPREEGPAARVPMVGDAFVTALAKELGVKADELRTALDKLRPDRGSGGSSRGPRGRGAGGPPPGGPPFGGPPPGGRFPGGPPPGSGPPPGGPPLGGPPPGARERGPGRGPSSAALAKALGIETAAVQAALDKLRAAKRDEFAAALAQRLDLPVERVKAALSKGP